MRGIKCLTTDISYLDPFEGIRFRGYTIPETLEKLPRAKGAEMPYVEGHLYLLLTGDIPTEDQVQEVIKDLQNRGKVPEYVWKTLKELAGRYASDDHVFNGNSWHSSVILFL